MNANTQQTGSQGVSFKKINLSEILEDIFMVLTDKEKDVVVKRFSLNNQPRMTLEKIGQQFSVTRERIRQIEKIALNKLKRTVANTRLQIISELAQEIIKSKGGVATESAIITDILNEIGSTQDLDAHIISLALNITQNLEKTEKSNVVRPYWRLSSVTDKQIKKIVETGMSILNRAGDIMDAQKLAQQIQQMLELKDIEAQENTILSSLEVDKRVKKLREGFGLMSWRHINPRSIRDKAYIVLKKAGNPLHFIEIANRISEAGFDKKVVTTQAVHNELIRYDQFVLVGRGLYALKEWGYKKGTVADIIEGLLRKKSPMTKQDIIQGVLKQRTVKKGTISLNLQKNPQFVRVGRAVYALDDSKK